MKLVNRLSYTPNELKFGTSGLRGLVSDMTDLECYINTIAFIEYCKVKYPSLRKVYVAGDLRDSTPRIVNAVITAVIDMGLDAYNLGLIPTPVLALKAFSDDAASIMVTGSHIPSDRNGIKYYKPDKELMKTDEAHLMELVDRKRSEIYALESDKFSLRGMLEHRKGVEINDLGAVNDYIRRFKPLCEGDPLRGVRVAFYEHSTVGRDIIPKILENAGADVFRFGRSKSFIPVDTENVDDSIREMAKDLLAKHPDIIAVLSADGDSDRPLFMDDVGRVHSGDMLGFVTSQLLGIDACAYPVSSSDVLDTNFNHSGVEFLRTKIGSPYVIEAVDSLRQDISLAGWEVNGGYMVGANVSYRGTAIDPLMTRDATLPLLAVLLSAHFNNKLPSKFFEQITPKRYSSAGLVDMDSFEDCRYVTSRLADVSFDLSEYFNINNGFTESIRTDLTDGVRIYFSNGDVAHVRGSGNAPQLRIYSLSNTQSRADDIVKICVGEDGIFDQIARSNC